MNIVLSVHHRLDINQGAPGVALRLASAYASLGHDVELVSFDDLPKMSFQAQAVVYPWWLARRLLRGSRVTGVDIVDATTGDLAVFGRLSRHLVPEHRRPVLVTRSNGLEHAARRALLTEVSKGHETIRWRYHVYWGGWRLVEVAGSLRTADLAFMLNERDRAYARDRLRVPEERLVTVRNGINPELLGLAGAGQRADQQAIGVAVVGRFTRKKGTTYLVPALTRLFKRYPEMCVGFFGTGVPDDEVRRAFPPEARPRISAASYFENASLSALLERYQIGVSASIEEGFGVSVVEMMACGLAPVVTETAGSVEIVRDLDNGLVVPVGNSAALEGAIERLLTTPWLLDRLRRRAFEDAQGYDWLTVAREQLQHYERVRELRRVR